MRRALVWRQLSTRGRSNVPSGAVCMWRRISDDYVFMGHHDYSCVFRIEEPTNPLCLVEEAWWCPIPCDEIPILDKPAKRGKADAK